MLICSRSQCVLGANAVRRGTLLNPNNGKVIANLLPGLGGELGVIGSDNVFYPDARAALQWVDDSTYGYLEMHGSGFVLLISGTVSTVCLFPSYRKYGVKAIAHA